MILMLNIYLLIHFHESFSKWRNRKSPIGLHKKIDYKAFDKKVSSNCYNIMFFVNEVLAISFNIAE